MEPTIEEYDGWRTSFQLLNWNDFKLGTIDEELYWHEDEIYAWTN